jgi:hypothetical protein
MTEEFGRRDMLRRVAITGAAVWTAPVLHSIAAPAHAQVSPVAEPCNHSLCVAACQEALPPPGRPNCAPVCEPLCDELCPKPNAPGGEEGRPCRCGEACDPSFFLVQNGACTTIACQ